MGFKVGRNPCNARGVNTRRVAIIVPPSVGGVKTLSLKLGLGLRRENFYVKEFYLKGRYAPEVWLNHIRLLRNINNIYDIVIYLGSIPPPGHNFSQMLKLLFIHGFVHFELINSIKLGNLKNKLGAIPPLVFFNTAKIFETIDFFICHSETTCEMNGIHQHKILLPQFVLPEDEVEVKEVASESSASKKESPRNYFRVVTYTSYAMSPRLLSTKSIISLFRVIASLLDKEIELIIIDPLSNSERSELHGLLRVRYSKPLPRRDFLRLLSQSDLYFEQCIDEEIRLGSIEAGLLGIPVAKITHKKYWEKQDYNEDEIILSWTFEKTLSKLLEYFTHIDYYKEYYSKNIRNFIYSKRCWNCVKKPLIQVLTKFT